MKSNLGFWALLLTWASLALADDAPMVLPAEPQIFVDFDRIDNAHASAPNPRLSA